MWPWKIPDLRNWTDGGKLLFSLTMIFSCNSFVNSVILYCPYLKIYFKSWTNCITPSWGTNDWAQNKWLLALRVKEQNYGNYHPQEMKDNFVSDEQQGIQIKSFVFVPYLFQRKLSWMTFTELNIHMIPFSNEGIHILKIFQWFLCYSKIYHSEIDKISRRQQPYNCNNKVSQKIKIPIMLQPREWRFILSIPWPCEKRRFTSH